VVTIDDAKGGAVAAEAPPGIRAHALDHGSAPGPVERFVPGGDDDRHAEAGRRHRVEDDARAVVGSPLDGESENLQKRNDRDVRYRA
jgi:hypothetical protein